MSRRVIIGLFLISSILLSINLVFAQECQLAIPRYGSVVCKEEGIERIQISFKPNDKYSTATHVCLSDCHLDPKDVDIDCDYSIGGWKAEVNGRVKYATGIFGTKSESVDWIREDSFLITASCRGIDFWITHPVKASSSASVTQTKIMLEEAWAGTLEYVPIPNTEGCTLNKVIDKYRGDTPVYSYFDPEGGETKAMPSSTYTSVNQMPTNWEIGQSYVFVKDWQTGIADISLTYDKQSKAYWCGGLSGSRKIYNVNEVISASGKCYAIPQSIYLSNIECCFPADCSWKGTTYTCNPDTWKCEETRPCNSQLECDQVFGEGICRNKQVTSWVCDFNKKWGNYAGTCIRQTKNVYQCPSDCTSEEYYNEDEGRCKPRVLLVDCPPNKCCKSGGNYKPKDCPSGLECCPTSDPIIGNCKVRCEEDETTENGGESLFRPGMLTSAGSIIAGIIIVAIIIGVVAWKKGYLHFERGAKTITPVKEVKPTPKEKPKTNVVFCTQCGSEQSKGTKFCTDCGHEMK